MSRFRKHLQSPQSLGEILSGGAMGRRAEFVVQLYRIQKSWTELVGAELARRTFPKQIRGKTLIVAVESPVWSQHLSTMKEQILKVVAERSGKDFQDLRFVTEAIVRRFEAPAARPEPEKAPAELSADEDLSTLLERLRKKSGALRRNS